MSKQKTDEQPETEQKKECFVIMPISDQPGYEKGHFQRVYDFIIKPACLLAGFEPKRADEVKSTNVIILDILERIISSEMAICDLSSKNGNVLYELGIRQAFDKPVTILKDDITDRIFDINTIREVPYNSQLRFDQVNFAVNELATAIKHTYDNKGKELNSLVGLLGINKAELKSSDLSPDTKILLQAISKLERREPSMVGEKVWSSRAMLANLERTTLSAIASKVTGQNFKAGDIVIHPDFGEGEVISIDLLGSITLNKDKPTIEIVIKFEKFGPVTFDWYSEAYGVLKQKNK